MQSRHGVLRRQLCPHVPLGLHKTHLLFTPISYCYRSILPSGQGKNSFQNCISEHWYPQYDAFTKQGIMNNPRKCDKECVLGKSYLVIIVKWCVIFWKVVEMYEL